MASSTASKSATPRGPAVPVMLHDTRRAALVVARRIALSSLSMIRTVAVVADRERAVLELMSSGATNPEIGEALHLSRHTVKEHSSSLYRKLGVRNRTEAVQRAQRLGLLR